MKLRIHPTIISARSWLLRYHFLLAAMLLLVFFGLSFGEMKGDSAIVDELAHVPASYSYVHYGDFRINPEHPPLLKDLAGIPLQFMNLDFPADTPNWSSALPEQYSIGYDFLYRYGNNAYDILFWSRLPLLLFATAFGAVFYVILRRRFGTSVALLALFFYALSPNFIAHSHFVTTDVGASVGMFLALVAFVGFLEQPGRRSILWLSAALALAQLTKFSSIVLYIFMLLMWVGILILRQSTQPWRLLKGIIYSSVLSLLIIYLWYVPNTLALTALRQRNLFAGDLSPYVSLYHGFGPMLAQICAPLSDYAILRPLLQYVLGLGMVVVRLGSGNVGYFNGEVSLQSFHGYFPEIFMFKTQIAFLLLLFGLAGIALTRFFTNRNHSVAKYLKYHRFEVVMASFATYYFVTAVTGNLNIGIRHILPIYPPLFALVALGTVRLVRSMPRKLVAIPVLTLILGWYGMSTITAYPNYVAYFNGLAGGPGEAYKYFSDSGIDWGQDLYRLKAYTDKHPEIKQLGLDYFGGSMPPYVFCDHVNNLDGRQNKGDAGIDCSHSIYHEWHASNGEYTGQYMAVSETYLMNDLYYAGSVYNGSYDYLRKRQPIAKIGYSIYLYKLY